MPVLINGPKGSPKANEWLLRLWLTLFLDTHIWSCFYSSYSPKTFIRFAELSLCVLFFYFYFYFCSWCRFIRVLPTLIQLQPWLMENLTSPLVWIPSLTLFVLGLALWIFYNFLCFFIGRLFALLFCWGRFVCGFNVAVNSLGKISLQMFLQHFWDDFVKCSRNLRSD